MMERNILLLVFVIALFSCNSNENKAKEKKDEKAIVEKSDENGLDKEQAENSLTIEGNDIWVRNAPSTGDVVMKLNDGAKCEIIKKGKKEQIRGMVDYWYKIKFNEKVGWVYGSQTSMKSGERPILQDFAEFLALFVRDGKANKDMKKYIHPQIGVYKGNNPGVMCTAGVEKAAKISFGASFSPNNIYNRSPKGDFCEGYAGEKNGFFFVEINKENLPKFGTFDENGDAQSFSIEMPADLNSTNFMKVTMVADEYHHAYLYFVAIDYQWYIVCQDYCDCSA